MIGDEDGDERKKKRGREGRGGLLLYMTWSAKFLLAGLPLAQIFP